MTKMASTWKDKVPTWHPINVSRKVHTEAVQNSPRHHHTYTGRPTQTFDVYAASQVGQQPAWHPHAVAHTPRNTCSTTPAVAAPSRTNQRPDHRARQLLLLLLLPDMRSCCCCRSGTTASNSLQTQAQHITSSRPAPRHMLVHTPNQQRCTAHTQPSPMPGAHSKPHAAPHHTHTVLGQAFQLGLRCVRDAGHAVQP